MNPKIVVAVVSLLAAIAFAIVTYYLVCAIIAPSATIGVVVLGVLALPFVLVAGLTSFAAGVVAPFVQLES